MAEEVKILIRDARAAERLLIKAGAKHAGMSRGIETYYNQPIGKALKVVESNRGNFVVRLKTGGGKFRVVENRRIHDAKKVKKEFSTKYGVKCILHKRRRFFILGKLKININRTRELGTFLIVEGENLNRAAVMRKLGISNPHYITVAFDVLYARKNKTRGN